MLVPDREKFSVFCELLCTPANGHAILCWRTAKTEKQPGLFLPISLLLIEVFYM